MYNVPTNKVLGIIDAVAANSKHILDERLGSPLQRVLAAERLIVCAQIAAELYQIAITAARVEKRKILEKHDL